MFLILAAMNRPTEKLPDGYTMVFDRPSNLTANTTYVLRFRLLNPTGNPAAASNTSDMGGMAMSGMAMSAALSKSISSTVEFHTAFHPPAATASFFR